MPRSPSWAALVVKPCSKTSVAMVASTPGPLSLTMQLHGAARLADLHLDPRASWPGTRDAGGGVDAVLHQVAEHGRHVEGGRRLERVEIGLLARPADSPAARPPPPTSPPAARRPGGPGPGGPRSGRARLAPRSGRRRSRPPRRSRRSGSARRWCAAGWRTRASGRAAARSCRGRRRSRSPGRPAGCGRAAWSPTRSCARRATTGIRFRTRTRPDLMTTASGSTPAGSGQHVAQPALDGRARPGDWPTASGGQRQQPGRQRIDHRHPVARVERDDALGDPGEDRLPLLDQRRRSRPAPGRASGA